MSKVRLLDLFEKKENALPVVYLDVLNNMEGINSQINYIKISFEHCRADDFICISFNSKNTWVKLKEYVNLNYIYDNFLEERYKNGDILESYSIRKVILIDLKINNTVFYKLSKDDVLSPDDCCFHPLDIKTIKLVSDTLSSKYVGKKISEIPSKSVYVRKGIFPK